MIVMLLLLLLPVALRNPVLFAVRRARLFVWVRAMCPVAVVYPHDFIPGSNPFKQIAWRAGAGHVRASYQKSKEVLN